MYGLNLTELNLNKTAAVEWLSPGTTLITLPHPYLNGKALMFVNVSPCLCHLNVTRLHLQPMLRV